jgi:hypothetical protein
MTLRGLRHRTGAEQVVVGGTYFRAKRVGSPSSGVRRQLAVRSCRLLIDKCIRVRVRMRSLGISLGFGQATKGARWMPRGKEPMKGAATGETRRGAGSKL